MAKVKESPYTYLYDKCFRYSSETDHNKALFRAQADVMKPTPIFENMFSDVRAYPKSEVRRSFKRMVPPWFLKDYSSHLKEINNYLLRYQEFGCRTENLQYLVPSTFRTSPQPDGTDRYKYFTNAKILPAIMLRPDVMKASIKTKKDYYMKLFEDVRQITRSIGTQTIYRESSSQTDPYSPQFLVRPGAEPEILTLIPLSYKKGLPVGLHEINMIERAKHRREVNKMFPNLTDIGEVRKRHAILSKLEVKEWQLREAQIDELQWLRLSLIMKLINERKENLEKIHKEAIERFFLGRIEEREEKQDIVHFEFTKAIRKLIKGRQKIEKGVMDKSLIIRYSDPLSVAFAPLTRIGQFLDFGSERYVVNTTFLTTYNGLCELENDLPSFVLNPKIKVPKVKNYTKDGYKTRKFRLEEELTELYKYMKMQNKVTVKVKPKPLKFLTKIEKVITRPPTPELDFDVSDECEMEDLANLLKQLIKGRAVQVMMYEGKEKRIDLINEIQSTHALHNEEMQIKEYEKSCIIGHQRQQIYFKNKESAVFELIESLEGQCLGDMCDFLGKELIRLQEERRLYAFELLASRERRMREAEESGLRQIEERRRREEDEIFKQLVKMHQTTIDSYLEDIINENINLTAKNIAQNDIEILAEYINNDAYELESKRNYLQTEEVVSDLVHHFLIPEVYKTEAREKMALNERRPLVQAHKEIVDKIEYVVNPSIRNDTKKVPKPHNRVSKSVQWEKDP